MQQTWLPAARLGCEVLRAHRELEICKQSQSLCQLCYHVNGVLDAMDSKAKKTSLWEAVAHAAGHMLEIEENYVRGAQARIQFILLNPFELK